MMNYTQSFEEFSSSLGPTDLALYAGVGIVLYVLFKDQLSPVQKMLMDLMESVKQFFENATKPTPPKPPVVGPIPNYPVPPAPPLVKPNDVKQDVFLELVSSWRRTRDLSEKYGCGQATEMLDQVFQYLSPVVCVDEENNNE